MVKVVHSWIKLHNCGGWWERRGTVVIALVALAFVLALVWWFVPREDPVGIDPAEAVHREIMQRLVNATNSAGLTVFSTKRTDDAEASSTRFEQIVVYDGPLNQSDIEGALRRAYTRCRFELEGITPSPRQLSIQIRFASSEVGARHGEILAGVETGAVARLPEWPPQIVWFNPRKPLARPTERDLKLCDAYSAILSRGREAVPTPWVDADGNERIPEDDELLASWDRVSLAQRRLLGEYARDHKISEREILSAYWRCTFWWRGEEATAAKVDEMVKLEMEPEAHLFKSLPE